MILYHPFRARRSIRAFWLSVRLCSGRAAATPALYQRPHLILHQAHQRRDHDGDARQQQGRHLIADGLARTCGHHGQHIPAGQQAGDDLLLTRAGSCRSRRLSSEYYARLPWFLLSIKTAPSLLQQCHLSWSCWLPYQGSWTQSGLRFITHRTPQTSWIAKHFGDISSFDSFSVHQNAIIRVTLSPSERLLAFAACSG